jgi:tRNA(Arg) A34 adenosine deaminase TadA
MNWNKTTKVSNKFSEKIFDLLKSESQNSDEIKSSSSYHAAAIVYKKKILAIGHSRKKTHPIMATVQPIKGRVFLHAEIDASIRAMNQYGAEILSKCDLYVLRTTKSGEIGNSCPCEGCWNFINNYANFKNVYWS